MGSRIVELLCLSDVRTPQEIASFAGICPDKAVVKGQVAEGPLSGRPAAEHSWILSAEGDDGTAVEALVEEVYERARVGREKLAALASTDCDFVLRIVTYATKDDRVSPGFVLSEDVVSFLAEVKAFVDIDLYVVD